MTNKIAFPDPGEPDQWYVPPAPEPGILDSVISWATDHTMTLIAVALAALVAANLLRRRNRNTISGTDEITGVDRAITRITALIATAVVAQGMWVFFSEVIRIHWAFRVVLFSFIEMQIITAVRRTRRYLHRHGTLGNGPWTIAGLAAATATLAAVHVTTTDERLLRLFAAAVAAHMLLEELREERDILRHRNPDKWPPLEKWTSKLRRAAAFIGLVEPTSLAVTEVATQRRIDRLARLLNHFHTVTADAEPGRIKRLYIAWLNRRVVRQTQAACKWINLAEDPNVREMLLRRLGIVRGVVEATKPDATNGAAAWASVVEVTDGSDAPRHVIDIDVTPNTQTVSGDSDGPKVTAPVTRQPSPAQTVTPQKVTPTSVTPTDAVTVTPEPTVTGTVTADAKPKRASNAVTLSPRKAVTTVAVTNTGVTNTKVQPLARHLIDAQFRNWTSKQVEDYAAERAQQVLAETGNKTAGMREYFLICLALGVEPKGSAMAKAVGASGGLGRGKAIEWHGQLAVDDAEQILREAHDRIIAELAGGDVRV